jgi:hypothetical protein
LIRTCALAASSRSSEYLGIESNSATVLVLPFVRIEVKLEKGGESAHSERMGVVTKRRVLRKGSEGGRKEVPSLRGMYDIKPESFMQIWPTTKSLRAFRPNHDWVDAEARTGIGRDTLPSPNIEHCLPPRKPSTTVEGVPTSHHFTLRQSVRTSAAMYTKEGSHSVALDE